MKQQKVILIALTGLIGLTDTSNSAEPLSSPHTKATLAGQTSPGAGPAPATASKSSKNSQNKKPDDLSGQRLSEAKTPKKDVKGETPPEYFNWRPRQSLGAVASQRKDELSGKASWDDNQPWSLHRMLDLPDWVSLTLEERVRYEDYDTPWMKGNTHGQYSVPIQTVLWGEARFTDTLRVGAEFWDARQYGSDHPNKLNNSMVNVGQFAQIYAAWINRDVFGTGFDAETKAGQMTMDIGSRRLLARAAFRNTQYQYVGLQNRLREKGGDWELLTFANVPEQLLPANNNPHALQQNQIIWNRPQTDAFFTGAFLTKKLPLSSNVELYIYYLYEGESNPLKRNLITPGTRLYANPRKGEFEYEIESIGQTGSARLGVTAKTKDVGSFLQHVAAGYTFDAPWDPRFLAQWDYASSHFDSLFSPTVFEYGPTGILGLFNRTNINSPGYRLFLVPHRDVTLYMANRFWWLADPRSSMGWSAAKLVDTSGKAGSFVGQTWELNARWDAHENIAFQAGWQVLQKGSFAMNAPGAPKDHSNVNYFFVQTEVRL